MEHKYFISRIVTANTWQLRCMKQKQIAILGKVVSKMVQLKLINLLLLFRNKLFYVNKNYNKQSSSQSMNKIKIINQDILHLMQSTAKQFKVNDQNNRFSQGTNRPKTPQEMFKSVIKQAAVTDMHFLRRQRLKTSEPALNTMKVQQEPQIRIEPFALIIQRKIDASEKMRERPTTSLNHKQRRKQNREKSHDQIDIKELKLSINEVLSQIKVDSQLCNIRKKLRYTEYERKKFGKYWKNYKVKLDKKTTSQTFFNSGEQESRNNLMKVSRNFNIHKMTHI